MLGSGGGLHQAGDALGSVSILVLLDAGLGHVTGWNFTATVKEFQSLFCWMLGSGHPDQTAGVGQGIHVSNLVLLDAGLGRVGLPIYLLQEGGFKPCSPGCWARAPA